MRTVPRNTRLSFGAFLTVFQVYRNDAETRINAILADRPDPAFSTPKVASPAAKSATPDAPSAEGELVGFELSQIAEDAIRAKIGSVFKGHKLSTLVGAILETQGYSVVVSPPGADGGVDILAGKGALGFEGPRLVVQVKSQDAPVDVSVLRELRGVMSQFKAEQGLLVAWGGVTKALAREPATMRPNTSSALFLRDTMSTCIKISTHLAVSFSTPLEATRINQNRKE